jgi:hypothetical protein
MTLGLDVAAAATDGFTIAGFVREGTSPSRGWLLRVGADGSVGTNCAATIGYSESITGIATDTTVTSATPAPWQEDLALGTEIDTMYGGASENFAGALVCGG